MKVSLSQEYWRRLLALPATQGVSSVVLWLRRSKWPLEITETGLTLRNRRSVAWRSIRKIGVSRSYRDGHISQIRIHYKGEISQVPIDALQDGEQVARVILAMFAALERARERARHSTAASASQSQHAPSPRGGSRPRDAVSLRGNRAEIPEFAFERRA